MNSRSLVGAAVAMLFTLGIAATSRLPVTVQRSAAALLRLSWTARPDWLETCRRVSPEEQAARLPHMRQTEVCEGRSARYALEVAVDGRLAILDTVQGGGARADRPIHVLRATPVEPGQRMVRVRWVRLDSPPQGSAARVVEGGLPPWLELDTAITLTPHSVVLVTLDSERRTLRALAGLPPRE